MKRIINGRLWDDSFMNNVAQRSFSAPDPVTGETKTYFEELKREYVIKPGHTLGDTWVAGEYGRKVVVDHCDLSKGQFILKVYQGWSDGTFVPITDEEARRWLEKWHPDDVDLYEKMFGSARNPWTDDGTVKLVEEAESRYRSVKFQKDNAEAEVERLKARLAAISKTAGSED